LVVSVIVADELPEVWLHLVPKGRKSLVSTTLLVLAFVIDLTLPRWSVMW
jgi:hypothetical protein